MTAPTARDTIRIVEVGDCSGAGESWTPTEFEIGRYMYGRCHALALELHKIVGFPICAIVEGSNFEETVIHVMLRAQDDKFLDIGGIRSLDDIRAFAEEEGEICSGWRVIAVTPDWVEAAVKDGGLPPIRAGDISEARKVAGRLVACVGFTGDPDARVQKPTV